MAATRNRISDFIDIVTSKSRSMRDWSLLYTKVPPARFGEILQLLKFHVKDKEAILLELEKSGELFVLANVKNALGLASFEKAMWEAFQEGEFAIESNILSQEVLTQMSDFISPHVTKDDPLSTLCLTRLTRAANTVVVLDDDLMALKLMDNIMGGLGNVIPTSTPAGFLTAYKDYAPNIVFIDIHLAGGESGIDVLEKLRNDLDPYAHAIMISADNQAQTILKLKGKGAKGFVLKPIKRETLLGHLVRAPMFHMRG